MQSKLVRDDSQNLSFLQMQQESWTSVHTLAGLLSPRSTA